MANSCQTSSLTVSKEENHLFSPTPYLLEVSILKYSLPLQFSMTLIWKLTGTLRKDSGLIGFCVSEDFILWCNSLKNIYDNLYTMKSIIISLWGKQYRFCYLTGCLMGTQHQTRPNQAHLLFFPPPQTCSSLSAPGFIRWHCWLTSCQLKVILFFYLCSTHLTYYQIHWYCHLTYLLLQTLLFLF